jgi:hypothetical protein
VKHDYEVNHPAGLHPLLVNDFLDYVSWEIVEQLGLAEPGEAGCLPGCDWP